MNIILTGLSMLLYLKELVVLKRIYKEEGIDINFYTVDVEEKKLVSMTDFLKRLKELSLHPRECMKLREIKEAYKYLHGEEGSTEEVMNWYNVYCSVRGWRSLCGSKDGMKKFS